MSLVPIISDGVSEQVSITIEASSLYGTTQAHWGFQAVTGILVPEVKEAVTAGGTESSISGMEGDGVDGVDGFIISMALESEITARRKMKYWR